jgi:DNA-binding transcriptional regulator YhcF (GntR family)
MPASHSNLSQSPAINQAYQYLYSRFDTNEWEAGQRLPILSMLAANARVSKNSMWKAVGLAAQKNLLTVMRGGHIIAGDNRASRRDLKLSITDVSTQSARQQLRLESDIINGNYNAEGVLPSIKELQSRYGVCGTTIRKILRSLCRQGIIIQERRSYYPAHTHRDRPRSTVLIISDGAEIGKAGVFNERLRRLINAVEMFSARSNIKAEFADLSAFSGSADKILRRYEKPDIPGSIFFLPESIDETKKELAVAAIDVIGKLNKPCAILDSLGTFSMPSRRSIPGTMQIFQMASRIAGKQAGLFMRNLGHRNIAFISHAHHEAWSIQRLAGVNQAFKNAEGICRIVPVTVDNVEAFLSQTFTLGSIAPVDAETFAAIASPTDQLDYLQKFFDDGRWPTLWKKEKVTQIRGHFKTMLKLFRDGLDPILLNPMRDALLHEITQARDAELFGSLFDQAIKLQYTAWILVNDGLAGNAFRYLMARSISIPQDISLMGFDNVPESLEEKLTTYDFNMPGILHQMLWFILRFGERRQTQSSSLEVEGMVIERETTGKRKA